MLYSLGMNTTHITIRKALSESSSLSEEYRMHSDAEGDAWLSIRDGGDEREFDRLYIGALQAMLAEIPANSPVARFFSDHGVSV